tara:strand:- start:449 stop:1009 length:561 start_codon:yes stop_codon:yes gene_type:complete
MSLLKKILTLLLVSTLIGCGAIPKDALRLTSLSLELRQMQQKEYANISEKQALIASANVLQDTGYIIKESDLELGLLLAEKDRTAFDAENQAAAIGGTVLIAVLSGLSGSTQPVEPIYADKNQKIRVSIIFRVQEGNSVNVRVSFQRIVWNTANQVSRLETIRDPEIYQSFYTKLDKSIFLAKEDV